jgi:hypothetical protein
MTDLPASNVEEKLGWLTYKNDHQSHITIGDPAVCLEKCEAKPCTTGPRLRLGAGTQEDRRQLRELHRVRRLPNGLPFPEHQVPLASGRVRRPIQVRLIFLISEPPRGGTVAGGFL